MGDEMKYNVVMLTSDDSAINKDSYFRKYLLYWQKKWGRVLILSPSKQGLRGFYKVGKGVWYYYFPSLFNFFLFCLSFHKINTKVFLSMDPYIYGFFSILLRYKPAKLIVEMHSHNLFNLMWVKYRKRHIFYHILATKYTLKKADAIRMVYYDSKVMSLYKGKVYFIPSNYLDKSVFKPEIGSKEFDVIYVGRLHPQKNIDYLCDIFSLLKKRGITCLVVGKGEKKYEMEIKKTGCTHLKWVSQEELVKLYQKSKVLVSVSYGEGGPRVAYEALTSGCLVASTPTGLIYDTLKHHPDCGVILCGIHVEEDVSKIIRLVKEYNKKRDCVNEVREKMNYYAQLNKYRDFVASFLERN